MTTLDNIFWKLDEILSRLEDVEEIVYAPQTVYTAEGLSDISENLGLQVAGEFRTGRGDPGKGDGFSGVRMGYPGFTYGGKEYNIVGVDADTLMFGLRSTDGAAVFGGGVDELNQYGIHVYDTDSKPAFVALSADETVNSEALGAGDVLIGNNDTDVSNVLWDASAETLYFRQGDLVVGKMASTDGGLGQIGARVYATTDGGIGDTDGFVRPASSSSFEEGEWHWVEFNAVTYDDGFWSSDNPTRLTVPAGQGGIYLVGAHVATSLTASTKNCWVDIVINGLDTKKVVTTFQTNSLYWHHVLIGETVLTAGDYLQVGMTVGFGTSDEFYYNNYESAPSLWIRRTR